MRNFNLYDLVTKCKTRIFNCEDIINMHDYIAIANFEGKHLVLKDRYRYEFNLNGFEESSHPYVIPDIMFNKEVIELLLLDDFEIYDIKNKCLTKEF